MSHKREPTDLSDDRITRVESEETASFGQLARIVLDKLPKKALVELLEENMSITRKRHAARDWAGYNHTYNIARACFIELSRGGASSSPDVINYAEKLVALGIECGLIDENELNSTPKGTYLTNSHRRENSSSPTFVHRKS